VKFKFIEVDGFGFFDCGLRGKWQLAGACQMRI
jgi:hypothetical protein